jgi:hypothetical protein
MAKRGFNPGDRVVTRIGDKRITGTAGSAKVWGPVNTRDYINVRDSRGKNHLALVRNTERAAAKSTPKRVTRAIRAGLKKASSRTAAAKSASRVKNS